ncbi:AraC family transcriptional regulator [Neogemmobacter tilapiae]|uniref:AraC family transcriptional regulator n=1 Tax=Neogemmobacter tilapiae TaxID=875041 RepID=A0A918TPF8_9RHOB|nr:AraC family transcriptional regulator [Gemmobacter tilapiae]GHC56725.1 AraC family transcriptional regulator [Gemmobacter tilapiae]
MPDPLAEIVTLLQPSAPFTKRASASGPWRVRRTDLAQALYVLTIAGRANLELDNRPPILLQTGDFALVPAAQAFTMSSVDPPPPPGLLNLPLRLDDGTYRLGPPDAPPQVQQLLGHCVFASPDAALLVPLLPDVVVVRGADRLGVLAGLVADEALAERPARDIVLQRLLEVLLIEALRARAETQASPGLLRGLHDPRLSSVLRQIHAAPARGWTVAELARAAGLSRSAFFTRFQREVGLPPMDYLMNWRMTLAKDLLRHGRLGIAEIATRVGYGSASAFSTAFSRRVGCPPAQYAAQHGGSVSADAQATLLG